MKRLCCIALALCFLCCAVPGVAEEDGEGWTLFESRFGFTLLYPQDQISFWEDEFDGEEAECFCPWEDHSGVAVLMCTGSHLSAGLWEDQTPISLDETDVWLEYPYEMTAYTDGDVITEQWIVSAADGDCVFIIQYEVGDYQGWAPLFHSVLETLEFPNQPAVNADFRLDFFQGGAAGMRFIDVMAEEDAEPLVLLPLQDMKSVSLEKVSWDEDAFAPAAAEAVYTAPILSPGDNLRVFCGFGDVLPTLRIRYMDADGLWQCLYIAQSGRDGSLLLIPEDGL